ncbi:kinesin-like protein KIN-13B [Rhododendron vialii]|uniref:kinesin-like protein KIN-13B n=1 Tax=Rhododendron vialii TaxID=182163 RepID=UPI00265E336C|nr:kinesin-like protein KIN-13B [Rhododendron vialii]
MNAMGRQGQRSGAPAAHHQRQHSDNFLDSSSSNGRWLQSAGLQHLHSSSNPSIPPPKDYGYYGGGQGSRMYKNSQRNVIGGSEFFTEPSTPPVNPLSVSWRKNSQDLESPNGFSPGLLDLHSFDTELLPEISVPGLCDAPSFYRSARGRSFDDSETYFVNNKQTGRVRAAAPENNVLKSFAADKDKASNVAKIKVVVRKRPLNKKELTKNEEDIITIEPHSSSLAVHETKLKVDLTEYVENHEFVFDAVLNEEVSNDEVYRETVEPIVPIIFQRTKATCFAYGQTGSGKTYTMKPLPLKASRDILRLMHHTYRNQGFQLFFSFFEIYGGKLFDLLSDRKKLCMREDGKQQVCIVGLQEYKVSDVETIKDLIERGNASRSTGTTGANEESSRSHAILQLAVKRSADCSETKPPRVVGKLSFIDLAGSERGADTTDNDKQTRMEGAEINKSLLALKECIRALDNDQGHIPFRGSKLTEVLRDSFVGDSRTVMISCISPNAGSCEHTLNTLRYADRVKSLSKGNNSKKDILSSTLNLRESTTIPLSGMTYEDDIADSWPENTDQEEFDDSEEFQEPEKPLWKNNGKVEAYGISNSEDKMRRTNGQTKWKDPLKFETKNSHGDDDMNALLKEEEDLVNAHRKLVEETMDIVREEMSLLVEADQPGNELDNYVCRLNVILSQKAAGILKLQNRLAHFQRCLKQHNVLVSSSGY